MDVSGEDRPTRIETHGRGGRSEDRHQESSSFLSEERGRWFYSFWIGVFVLSLEIMEIDVELFGYGVREKRNGFS